MTIILEELLHLQNEQQHSDFINLAHVHMTLVKDDFTYLNCTLLVLHLTQGFSTLDQVWNLTAMYNLCLVYDKNLYADKSLCTVALLSLVTFICNPRRQNCACNAFLIQYVSISFTCTHYLQLICALSLSSTVCTYLCYIIFLHSYTYIVLVWLAVRAIQKFTINPHIYVSLCKQFYT